jgi:hypothetical protein
MLSGLDKILVRISNAFLKGNSNLKTNLTQKELNIAFSQNH